MSTAADVSPTAAGTAAESQAERLQRARSVLSRATTTGKINRPLCTDDVSVPGAEVVAVDPVLAGLFPGGGLPRGSTVSLAHSNTLLFCLLAHASAAGSWCALVGSLNVGWVAASEAGLDLSKTAIISRPGDHLLAVLSALLDGGLDLVVAAGTEQLRPTDRQRLAARARQRGAVLLVVGSWPGADLHVDTIHTFGGWQGLGGPGQGHGRLRARRVEVRVTGRGAGRVARSAPVLLPGPTGVLAAQPRLSAASAGEPRRRAS